MEMVKKVTVSLLDDLDGKAADETVQFALDGVSYEIDRSVGEERPEIAQRVAALGGRWPTNRRISPPPRRSASQRVDRSHRKRRHPHMGTQEWP